MSFNVDNVEIRNEGGVNHNDQNQKSCFDPLIDGYDSIANHFKIFLNTSPVKEIKDYAVKWYAPQGDRWIRAELFLDFIVPTFDIITKIVCSVLSLIPGSSKIANGWIDQKATHGLTSQNTNLILPSLFAFTALTINPFANIQDLKNSKGIPQVLKPVCLSEKILDYGITLSKAGLQEGEEDGLIDWLLRNVAARVTILVGAVSLLVEQIIHLAIGILLSGCALFMLFNDKHLNDLAISYLTGLEGITNFLNNMRLACYPWQPLANKIQVSIHDSMVPYYSDDDMIELGN